METHKLRYEGVRWGLAYGRYDGIEEFAVNELQRGVQAYLPYVMEVTSADRKTLDKEENLILVGTDKDNRHIADLVARGLVSVPAAPEGYAIAVFNSPWPRIKKAIVVTGADAKGVLNGTVDFLARVLCPLPNTSADPVRRRESLEWLTDVSIAEVPAVDNRGIWTWGYVIYDYRRFLDNMARLKMNMLTVWNDCPPVNIRRIVDYAHDRGIKIIMGFHWGWGTDVSLSNLEDRRRVKEEVLRNYEQNYSDPGIDGIYFQTVTEHSDLDAGSRSTAALACEWVNDIAGGLYAKYPDLYIQFGLHATSIIEHYMELKPLDPRIAIVWEDAGTTPFAYMPSNRFQADSHLAKHGLGTFEQTLDYSRKLAGFRNTAEVGFCPKGWASIDWGRDFEHHGPFILGERSPEFIRRRLADREAWLQGQSMKWERCYADVVRFYREVRACAKGKMTAVALVEDGLFEERIQASVAAFAHSVWDPRKSAEEIREMAASPYYTSI